MNLNFPAVTNQSSLKHFNFYKNWFYGKNFLVSSSRESGGTSYISGEKGQSSYKSGENGVSRSKESEGSKSKENGQSFQTKTFKGISFEKSSEKISEEIEGSIKNTGEFKCGKIYFIEII